MSKVPVESYFGDPSAWIEVEYMGNYDINSDHFSLVLLNSVNEKNRQISFITDKDYASMMQLRVNGVEITARTLPIEIVYDFIASYNDPDRFLVIVNGYKDGVYHSVLWNGYDDFTFDLKMSDAVHLSLGHGMKIFILKDLFDSLASDHFERVNKVGMPIKMLPLEILKKALDDCIADERFEQAKQIKEEIERRNPSESISLN